MTPVCNGLLARQTYEHSQGVSSVGQLKNTDPKWTNNIKIQLTVGDLTIYNNWSYNLVHPIKTILKIKLITLWMIEHLIESKNIFMEPTVEVRLLF